MAQNKRLESRRQEGRMDRETKTTMENANGVTTMAVMTT